MGICMVNNKILQVKTSTGPCSVFCRAITFLAPRSYDQIVIDYVSFKNVHNLKISVVNHRKLEKLYINNFDRFVFV